MRRDYSRLIREEKGFSVYCSNSKDLRLVLTKICDRLHSQLFLSSKTCSLKEFWASDFTVCTLDIVECSYWALSDATTLAARNPGFLPVCLIFNHNKLLVRQNDYNLLFNDISKMTDLLEELTKNQCFPCLWIKLVTWARSCSSWSRGTSRH